MDQCWWPRARRGADGDDHVRLGRQQLAHQAGQRFRPQPDARVEDEVAAFDEAEPGQLRQGELAGQLFADRRIREVPEAVDAVRGLRERRLSARGQQRSCGRPAKSSNEGASSHVVLRSLEAKSGTSAVVRTRPHDCKASCTGFRSWTSVLLAPSDRHDERARGGGAATMPPQLAYAKLPTETRVSAPRHVAELRDRTANDPLVAFAGARDCPVQAPRLAGRNHEGESDAHSSATRTWYR